MNKKQKMILVVGIFLFFIVIFIVRSYNVTLSMQLFSMEMKLITSNANGIVMGEFETLKSMTYSYYMKSLLTLWAVIIILTVFNFVLARERKKITNDKIV